MTHSVPSHIVQKVADYAHRKASYSLMDYLEEFMKLIYRKRRIAKDIMSNAAHKIVEKVLAREKYQIMLTGVNEGLITFWIDIRWGEIMINSPFETLQEALTLMVSEMKESEADDRNDKKLMRKA